MYLPRTNFDIKNYGNETARNTHRWTPNFDEHITNI